MKKLKYKVGDIVRLVKKHDSSRNIPNEIIGRSFKIFEVDESDDNLQYHGFLIGFDVYDYKNYIDYLRWFREDEIELYTENITEEKLKRMPRGSMIITNEPEKHNIYVKNDNDEFVNEYKQSLYTYDFDDETLTFCSNNNEPRIDEICLPVYYTIYKKEEPVEMTIEEISEQLGYNVKIVKSK
jgi:hypothetical protein